jgi:hypothetical protein
MQDDKALTFRERVTHVIKLPETFRTPLLAFGAAALGCAILAAACSGGGGGSSGAFFEPDGIDDYLDDLLPTSEELPGSGWEETGRSLDATSDDDDGLAFEEFVATTPACSELAEVAKLSAVFGEKEEPSLAAGSVEFERASADTLIPTSVEVEVAIEETRSEVEGSWGIVKEVLESDGTAACFEEVINSAFTSSLEEQGAPTGIEATVTTVSPSAEAPQDGAAMAFTLDMSVLGIEIDALMEFYFWPYGNAAVTTMVFGESAGISGEEIGDILAAVDSRLVEEEAEY